MQSLTESRDRKPGDTHRGGITFCEEKRKLLDNFLQAIHELNILHREQVQAVIEEDPDFTRFDILLHLAQERKDAAKYAWIIHVENHQCTEGY